jgi:pyruvate/oxaloacetate carboxyltransferase
MSKDKKFDKHGEVEMTEMHYGPKRPKATNPVKVQDLTFRDGHQSLFATRGRTEDKIAIAEDMDKVGFYSMEVWGGATFDTMHRYLNEDPWDRITILKKYIKKTPFSMLLRGQNLVGYRNYADDVVEAFVQRACEHGIDIFRVFDACNDFRNFQTCVKVILKNKKHFQGTICYSLTEQRMGGEVYNLEYYLEKARQLADMGADSICIKDMAGLIAPYDAYNLVKALKETVSVPINLHSHFTSGMADLTMLKAIEAGVDIIDTCLAPYAYRSSHPAIEPLVVTLLGTNRDTGFEIEQLAKISAKIEETIPKYTQYMDQTKFSIIDTNVLLHQTPGGMISNLVSQLKQMNELDKLEKVFETLPKIRKDLGQVPLVTPTSQIVGIQTVNNVLFDKEGEEYTKITEQVKDLCFGLYGKTPRPISKELQKKALANYRRGEEPITVRPGEVLKPELETAKERIGELAKNIDDVLIYALFPITGMQYLKWKYGHEEAPPEVKAITLEDIKKEQELIEKAKAGKLVEKSTKVAPEKPAHVRAFDVFVDGEYFKVEIDEPGGTPHVMTSAAPVYKPATVVAPTAAPATKAAPVATATAPKAQVVVGEGDVPIKAPMPGLITGIEKKVGDQVKAGETIIVIEAMKMNNNISAPSNGIIKEISCQVGKSVAKEDIICVIKS